MGSSKLLGLIAMLLMLLLPMLAKGDDNIFDDILGTYITFISNTKYDIIYIVTWSNN